MTPRFLHYLAIPCLFLLSCDGDNDGEEGCTDSLAINYNATATVDDGTCIYEGCTDPEAFNYAPEATVDNGECIYEGCTDPAALNYDPEASIDDGSCEYPPNPGDCSEVEFDGHTYAVVEIGAQCWFAENLQTTVFASGTSIEEVTSDDDWSQLTTPAQCIYENEALNLPVYGRLYNAFAVNSEEGLCPTGWHVPKDDEWTELTDYLGGLSVAGGKLKEVGNDLWNWPNEGATNEVGFTALPGGYRVNGYFRASRRDSYWWSATPRYSGSSWSRRLRYTNANVTRASSNWRNGFSVRCLRD